MAMHTAIELAIVATPIRRFSLLCALACAAIGCDPTPETVGHEPEDGTGTGGTKPIDKVDGTSGTTDPEGGTTTDILPEECFNEGDPCRQPGARCSYGDDCGTWEYECQGGSWVQVDGTGCGGDPVACDDAPVPGDSCDLEAPPCDRDGDCLDVLECEAYSWVAYDVCTTDYCAAAAPQSGKACDEPNRSCGVENECGSRLFNCVEGYWRFTGGDICEIPQPCSAGPVPNDACAVAGEVCELPNPNAARLTCRDNIWTDEP